MLNTSVTHKNRNLTSQSYAKVADYPRNYRILMIAPTSFFADYGCHVRILEEARVLKALGHEVTIVTYRNGGPVVDMDIRRTLPIPWRREYEVGASRHMIAFDALLGLKSLELVMRNHYDIIHAHMHEGALIGLVLSKLFGIPIVFDFQGSATEECIDKNFMRRDSFFYKVLRKIETWIDHSSPVIFPSTANAERVLLEQFDCRPEQIRVLPDCVNAEVFKPAEEFDADELAMLRYQLGIPQSSKLIVYLGLLAPYQGTDLLLEAMQRILQQHDNVYLLLMGFPGITHYEKMATTLGIRDSVIFTGRVPYSQAPIYLALGDVAVAPKLSKTEGAGKLLNYMATALPTVAFDTPVAREYLGLDGVLAKRGDANSLAKKLSDCLFPPENTPYMYQRMGQRLRQRAIQHFEWHNAGRQIENTYRELLGDIPKEKITQRWVTGQK